MEMPFASLSASESEVQGSLFSLQEGLFLQHVVEIPCGHLVHLRHRIDSSSRRSFVDRADLGRASILTLRCISLGSRSASSEHV